MSSVLSQFNFQILPPVTNSEKPSSLPPPLRVVFLHGLMGSLRNWKSVVLAFQREVPHSEILVFDQRGHGRSFKPESGYSPKDYAQDLLQIVDSLNWPSFALVGHSMGGRNALAFASLYPQKVQKLTIEDIGPDPHPEVLQQYEKLLDSIPTPFADKRQEKNLLMNHFHQIQWKRDPKGLLGQFLYTNLEEKPDGQVDWIFSRQAILDSVREGRQKDSWTEWESLQCPVLLLRGESSRELTDGVFHQMLQRQTKAKGVQIPNAGHWVHYDQPQIFVRVLCEFLTK